MTEPLEEMGANRSPGEFGHYTKKPNKLRTIVQAPYAKQLSFVPYNFAMRLHEKICPPRCAGILCIILLAVGCGADEKKDASEAAEEDWPASPTGPRANLPSGQNLEGEIQELADRVKSDEQWLISREYDEGIYNILSVDSTKITTEELHLIRKAKTLQGVYILHASNLSDDHLKIIAGYPWLECIRLTADSLTDEGFKHLEKCKRLDAVTLSRIWNAEKLSGKATQSLGRIENLRCLSLLGFRVGGDSLSTLPQAKRLRFVELRSANGLDDRVIEYLTAVSNLENLELRAGAFDDVQITPAALKKFVQKHMPIRLTIPSQPIDDELLTVLIKKGWLHGTSPIHKKYRMPTTPDDITFVPVNNSQITDKGVQLLTQFKNIDYLHLDGTRITDAALPTIANFNKLKQLNLSKTAITGKTFDQIAHLPIETLIVTECPLEKNAFAAIGKMKSLDWLDANKTPTKSAWVEHLIHSPKLSLLFLNETQLTDEGLESLATMLNLKRLEVDQTSVTKAAAERVRKERPDLNIPPVEPSSEN